MLSHLQNSNIHPPQFRPALILFRKQIPYLWLPSQLTKKFALLLKRLPIDRIVRVQRVAWMPGVRWVGRAVRIEGAEGLVPRVARVGGVPGKWIARVPGRRHLGLRFNRFGAG